MNVESNNQFHKYLYGIALAGVILTIYLFMSSSSIARAQEAATPTPNPYFTVNQVTLADGTVVEEDIIKGPPVPPPGFEIQRQAVSLPVSDAATGINTLTVPTYPWIFGCSAVSGAMIAGYYDRNGYSNIYTGPTNGGVMPLFDSSSWGSWTDGGTWGNGGAQTIYFNNPLVASKNGLDGRTTRGSIDDYWFQYYSTAPDPYVTGGWDQHVWWNQNPASIGASIGDYMLTSQSTYGLADAYTRFYDNWSNPAAPLTCDTMKFNSLVPDGTVGRKHFYESRGYTVTDCYNQFTDNQYSGGFSFAQYKAEIDAGRPVMLNLAGHTIVGVGYDASTNTVYIHDTWDNLTHTMTWGGSYAGMELVSVSIVNLQSATPAAFTKSSPANATTQPTNPTLSWVASSNAMSYEYCLSTTTCKAANTWVSTGSATSKAFSGLYPGVTYTWQVRARNAAGITYADGSLTTPWTFIVLPKPGTFNKSSPPVNGDTNQPTNPTLNWETSSNASSYEYCLSTTTCTAASTWVPTGSATSKAFSGLYPGVTYTWQVRARNVMGITYANGSLTTAWTFTVLPKPDVFNKSSPPANGETNILPNPTLSWGTSNNASSYEYCLSTTTCTTANTWVSTGSTTSKTFSGLFPGIKYTWQVRARNATGITYADGGTLWMFTVLPKPAAFNKSSPDNNATNQPTNPTLSWEPSSNASSYEYCINTTASCPDPSAWISSDTSTSVTLSGLTTGTYYWQVRATNASGITYPDSGIWWSFTIP